MSVTEMKEIIKTKIDHLSDEELEKKFSNIISAVEFDDKNKIDLNKYAPGIFEKYDDLMKKLA